MREHKVMFVGLTMSPPLLVTSCRPAVQHYRRHMASNTGWKMMEQIRDGPFQQGSVDVSMILWIGKMVTLNIEDSAGNKCDRLWPVFESLCYAFLFLFSFLFFAILDHSFTVASRFLSPVFSLFSLFNRLFILNERKKE